MIDFYGLFSVDAAYVFTGMAAVTLISLIIAIISICKTSSMKKKYKEFMGGSDGTSIEELIKGNLEDVNQIKKLSIENENNIKDIYEKLEYTFQKIGIVKYDAFHEMGGKLSFALALLDSDNTGWIMNAMHSREGCYTYVKEILKGESYVELSEEEAEALDRAIYSEDYMSSESESTSEENEAKTIRKEQPRKAAKKEARKDTNKEIKNARR